MAQTLNERIVQAYYDTTASRGHSPTREHYERSSRGLKRRFQAWFPQNKEARCLDLACGCGEFIYSLASAGYTNLDGADLCEAEIQKSQAFVKGTLVNTDVLDYLKATAACSYDFISALNLLEHLTREKLLAVLQECRRVLRPDGTMVVMVPNAVSPFGSLTRHWDITHQWAFTTNNFRQLASLVGFSPDVEFRECGPTVHGIISGARYFLWQILRAGIATWFLIELGTTKDGIYTMDMLVRLRVPSK